MTMAKDTIRVLIPLKVRKKNGRPKILPPADYRPSEDQSQDPHILRAIGRAWGWRRRMEASEFATIQELAEAVGLAERHVSRQLRLAYLAPDAAVFFHIGLDDDSFRAGLQRLEHGHCRANAMNTRDVTCC